LHLTEDRQGQAERGQDPAWIDVRSLRAVDDPDDLGVDACGRRLTLGATGGVSAKQGDSRCCPRTAAGATPPASGRWKST
jgi:hypothetical protein